MLAEACREGGAAVLPLLPGARRRSNSGPSRGVMPVSFLLCLRSHLARLLAGAPRLARPAWLAGPPNAAEVCHALVSRASPQEG